MKAFLAFIQDPDLGDFEGVFTDVDAGTVENLFGRWVPADPKEGEMTTDSITGELIRLSEAFGFRQGESEIGPDALVKADRERARARVTSAMNVPMTPEVLYLLCADSFCDHKTVRK